LETEAEANIRISIQFGPEDRNRAAKIEEEEAMIKKVKNQLLREKQNDKQTIQGKMLEMSKSKNAGDAQRKLRMQVEDLVNHEKRAKEFLNTHQETKRNFQSRARDGNTNFIQENKHDAKVWQDLD
jgi:hypothetical protein